ncbi:hypothetical protein QYE76_070028 [Lolium multiflorum]|uniref:Large ribosomal subunit protein mL43 n=1 Tax=Lolium multiflorum TaxID=4521 RepID=A0AAD8SIL2_LOLMU|nr:hypothetical protein QYE76_070028 [Lolium multiflorum]
MALRGVWQLQKLVVNYCDWGGSSRGIRAFMESHLPALKEKNPQLEVVTQLVRGQHPNLKGIYRAPRMAISRFGRGTNVEWHEHPKRRDKSSGKDIDDTATGIKMLGSSPYYGQAK